MGKNEPSAAEWRILRIVADRSPCAARDVVEACATEGEEWSPSTIKTLLRRLVEKGHLKTRRIGNSFLYRPARSMLASLRKAADTLLRNTNEDDLAPLLAYMVRKGRLSTEDLQSLRELLDAEEGSR